MGREIRMVPENWEHPKNEYGVFQPMFDTHFDDAVKEWKDAYNQWENGEYPDYADQEDKKLQYWEWNGDPPDRAYYRSFTDDEKSWYQVYETVSEGTPVSPAFATKKELVDYLTENGDFWDQKRGSKPLAREQYEKFVDTEFAPSFVMQGNIIQSGIESL